MNGKDQVTFAGSGLDRAGHLRHDKDTLRSTQAHPRARCLPVWRGKVLAQGEDRSSLLLVPLSHRALAEYNNAPILLGIDEDKAPIFAVDVSDWDPVDQDLSTVGGFFDPSEQIMPAIGPDAVFVELRRIMARLSDRDAEVAAMAKSILGWHATHQFCARCGQPSEIRQGGWQRVCLSCDGQHFPRTDPVVIMLITHGDDVLMGRSPGWPEGMYSLLAGFIDAGETVEAAVRREVMEEAGVPVGDVRYLASQPWPFPSSLMIGCAGTALDREITIDPIEIQDAMWVSRQDMADAFSGTHAFMKPARKGSIAHYLLENWLRDRW
jgi:NAD+ diphosphatase